MDYEGALLGECLGNYRLVRVIGCGSMGEVYEAEHVLIGRRVAVKVLLHSLSQSEEAVLRFFTEARSAATMRHPGIVEVFDFGYHASGSAYIIMELLEGETVAERVERHGPIPVNEAVAIGRRLAQAMACAHANGVIHRDLKPENLFLIPDEDVDGGIRVKVLDFGIAKLATASLFGCRSTRAGQIMGTPAFMSPEQCHGACEIDERADVYALGCILYFMLTGRPPFDSEGVGEVIAQQLYDTPLPPAKHVEGIPGRINALVMQLLEKNPDRRPSSMDEVAKLLNSWLMREADNTVPIARPTPAPTEPAREVPLKLPLPAPPVELDVSAFTEKTAQVPRLPARFLRGPRGTWRRWLTGGAVAISAAGVLSWLWMHDGLAELVGPPSVEAAPLVDRPVEPTPSAPGFTGLPHPQERHVTLEIKTQPAGATVVRASDGLKLGATPLSVDLPVSDGATELRLSKQGFHNQMIKVPADRDAQASIVLAPSVTAKPVVPRTAALPRKTRVAAAVATKR
jgi:eukaryotic-like serine/threonine-protein kinase